MRVNKIIRSICWFASDPSEESIDKLKQIEKILSNSGYAIQTKRLCSPAIEKIMVMDKNYAKDGYILGVGSINQKELNRYFADLLNCTNTH